MRIETIGPCTLYCGDCLDVLPGLGKVDAVVTDPPYGMNNDCDYTRFTMTENGHGAVSKRTYKPIEGDDKPFDPSFLLAYGSEQIIWGWNHFPDKLPRGACLVWLKRHDEAFGSFLSDAETAWMSKGCGVYCQRDLSNNAITRQRSHPTQKPVSLMDWCLGFLPNAETVLDPFMGSGTTGVACIKAGRQFIGIEKHEPYFEIACARIRRAWQEKQSELVFEPEPQHVQRSLLEVT